jgi:hypothetical protein
MVDLLLGGARLLESISNSVPAHNRTGPVVAFTTTALRANIGDAKKMAQP